MSSWGSFRRTLSISSLMSIIMDQWKFAATELSILLFANLKLYNKHREYHYFEETKVLDTHNSNWSISLSNMLFAILYLFFLIITLIGVALPLFNIEHTIIKIYLVSQLKYPFNWRTVKIVKIYKYRVLNPN